MTEQDRGYLSTVSAPAAARRLVGCELVHHIDGREVRVRIVETEAYDQTDAASHSYNGRTQRVDVMFGPAGHLYVYFTYGMHYCCNIVVGPEGFGAAVLIRAVEPLTGIETLAQRRAKEGVDITNGPAKLCQALGIDKRMNGHDLAKEPLQLIMKPQLTDDTVTTATRIGISNAVDMPWRFYETANDFVSRK